MSRVTGAVACVLASLGAGCGSAATPSDGATTQQSSSPPPLVWRDIGRVNVLCVAVSDDPGERAAVERRLCERVRALAASGAPVPVAEIAPGDPAVLAADATTLLVHASVQPTAGGARLLAFSIRPYRVSADQSSVLFGAAPRAVLLSGREGDGALDAALSAALGDLLPWRAGRNAPRPIR